MDWTWAPYNFGPSPLPYLLNYANDIGFSANIVKGEHPESKLVFLLTVCLLLKSFPLWPGFIWDTFFPICFLVEIPLCLIMLESSLTYVWTPLKEYLLLYDDDILVYLLDDPQFEWLICPLCGGKSNCSVVFTNWILKLSSFISLLMTAFATRCFEK